LAVSLKDRITSVGRPLVFLGRNPWTMAGAVLTTSSAITLIASWVVEQVAGHGMHPYAGILFFLVLPGIFIAGLLLIPIGLVLRRRQLRSSGNLPDAYPAIDLNLPFYRNALLVVAFLTVVNVAITGVATYKGVEYMDSSQFCGLTCHTVMQPEWTAFVDSPHARVGCVGCHIGPGAPWFVRSKLSGVRQVFAVALGTYSQPIPTPVHNLRPARETCEQCHWPQRFHGDRMVVKTKFSEDEANTKLTTVLVMKIGGNGPDGGQGIHGHHLSENARITYTAIDAERQQIPRVTWIDDAGQQVEFVSSDVEVTPEQLAVAETREMDCLDCHTRPSHRFDLPERAVDEALAEGRMSPGLPWIKKQAVALLRADYPDRETAARRIPEELTHYYRSQHADRFRELRPEIERAGRATADIYLRNVFPQMKVSWGTYADNIGHEDFIGCFRCHDESHESGDGRVITQDCDTCHTILAMEEEETPPVLEQLGFSAG